ncbi:MAG: type IV pili twitching motility protein PilT [Candidatus Komeilibacteria bacterium CG10_big_fil_rev_8_21_14_0_10_41_13]|uniref:Type IV pili twitching motility protein PilT n=1 Tax=Candidatus Komeilibacteria bacterium CG10_big_fil_rev_8_21_14_0_10_41_13 TaxID=1974476 RepID=A0A2M6WCN1_9BACT|nr:MAG: type IV pili twitching motility protein PilT [Candidatus Komeilibacteria bacterium CG10_big_fil_rev_8_21_14_0_10_41_13]
MTINQLFETAVQKKASDIHLIVDKQPILRIDGDLLPIDKTEKLTKTGLEKMVYAILTPNQKAKFLEERGLDFSYEIEDGSRFRVNVFWEMDKISLVARIISSDIPSMEEIAMPQIMYEMTRDRQGLILVTGPTGCGKSTTLAAMINLINSERTAKIVTLEDPVEFLFKSDKSVIVQRQLGTDMISFKKALKHILRQDPDVIMVGEMRDLETISATITLAETGHLVLATLHTLNAAQTIDRIVDVFPPYQQNQVRLQLSMSLNGVLSQQLLPKSGGGRIAAREILINTPAIANIIRENKIPQIKTAIQTGADMGMITLEQDLTRLVSDGLVEEEVAEYYLKTLPKF